MFGSRQHVAAVSRLREAGVASTFTRRIVSPVDLDISLDYTAIP